MTVTLNANVLSLISSCQRGMAKCPRKVLEFLTMNAKFKMSLLPKRCWSDFASCTSSLLLYNYLLTFTVSDSCESLKKGFKNITIMQLPGNGA